MNLLARRSRTPIEATKLSLGYVATRESLKRIGLNLLGIDLIEEKTNRPTFRVKMPGT